MKLIKSEKGTFKSKIPFLYLAVVIAIIFTSYGYAALNTELSISGEAYVRVETDIRVTNIKVLSSENKGYETYNNKYTKDTTSTFVTLPDSNSKLTYEIEITNDSNSVYYLSDILENSYSNKNIKYEIQDISVGDIIPSNTVKKIKIVFTTNTPNQDTAVVLQYVFKKVEQTEWVYAYTGGEQTFTPPYNGRYKLETWGAQGGNSSNNSTFGGYNGSQAIGGYGGYSSGMVTLSKNQMLNIVVGGGGTSSGMNEFSVTKGGYNGGGNGGKGNTSFSSIGCYSGAGGGGATHIAKISGILSSLENNKDDILIVSGGGGGAINHNVENNNGGSAGGIYGNAGSFLKVTTCNTNLPKISGGTQNSGYLFGMGQTGRDAVNAYCGQSGAAGGGGGFYGGMSQTENYDTSTGGGGSGYIGNPILTDKVMYCYNCTESSEESTKTISTTCTSATPTANCAKQGNGYAKITFID